MPRKPKHSERSQLDYYRTPEWAIERLLASRFIEQRLGLYDRILEPCAGDGVILDALKNRFSWASIDASDVQPRRDDIQQSVFNFWSDTGLRYDMIITNPPFSRAEDFVRVSLSMITQRGHVVFLLPVGFIASQGRASLFERERRMPLWMFVLTQRPSFKSAELDGSGPTDATDYAWFVFGAKPNTTTKLERL